MPPTWTQPNKQSSFENIGANSGEDTMDHILLVDCEYLGSEQYSWGNGHLGGSDHIVAMVTQYRMDVGLESFNVQE